MKVDVEALRAAFKIVDQVTVQPGMDSSAFLRLYCRAKLLYLGMCGDLRAQAKITIPEEGKWIFYVERRMFKAALDACTEKTADLSIDGKTLVLKTKGRKVQFQPHATVSGYEPWEGGPTRDLSSWVPALQRIQEFAPTDPGNEHMEAICFSKGFGLIATDSMFMAAVLDPTVNVDFYLPTAAAQVIVKDGGKRIVLEKDGVGVLFDKGYLHQPLPALLKKYPQEKVKGVLKMAQTLKANFTCRAADLQEGFSFLGSLPTGPDRDVCLEAEPMKAGLTLRLNLDSGSAEHVVPLQSMGNPDSTKLKWPLSKLPHWITSVSKESEEAVLSFAHAENCNVFSLKGKTQHELLLFADL